MDATTPRFAELIAPAHWKVVDFISDLHLQPGEPATVELWRHYMSHTRADAVFILGDLFEVWVGDDGPAATDAEAHFERTCAGVLRTASAQRPVYFMHGNRDFLLGEDFARDTGMVLLSDPTVLDFGDQRWLLSHGDAMCLDDREYLQFRQQVRHPDWQRDFLARPLSERREVARGLREQSEARKRSGAVYADVDADLTHSSLQAANARHLIHGHTHRPADHALANDRMRHVLSDWDALATPLRAEVLRLSLASQTGPVRLQRIDAASVG